MRSFIALELTAPVQKALAELQGTLRPLLPEARWTQPEGTHLTLKFLGEVGQSQVAAIQAELDKLAQGFQPFEIALGSIGAFPRWRAPRVIWVGIRESEILRQLHRDIETAIAPLGFPTENRSFKAHLTLARLAGENWSAALQERVAGYREPAPGLTWLLNEIVLFKSELRPTGAVYTPLQVSRFKTG